MVLNFTRDRAVLFSFLLVKNIFYVTIFNKISQFVSIFEVVAKFCTTK